MKKFTIFSGLLFFTTIAIAHQSYIVMSPDESRTIVDIPQEMKDLSAERKRQIKEHGYIPMYSKNAEMLMAMKDEKGTLESLPDDVPYFATLRLNTLDFKLTFPFDGFPSIAKTDLIGFVPGASYVDATGEWTGLTAYFTHTNLGVCRLVIWDMPAANGQSIYDSKFVAFDINKKPTFTSASGSSESGFIYETSWTGGRYEKMLDCANTKPFDRKTIKDLVALAKKLDKDLPDNP